eukprot:gene6655-8234_t
MSRSKPNILITGTPGTGKSSLSEVLASSHQMKHLDIGVLVKEKELHDGWDSEFQCWILDEDKVCDELEDTMNLGGCIVDHHGCDWFPERWFDLVIVLRTEPKTLFERLTKRNYSELKITNNLDCEILQVILEEAIASYKSEIIMELQSNTLEDNEQNQNVVSEWIEKWLKNRSEI